MTLIPLSIILTALKLAVEILSTFNGLPKDLQTQIVRDILRDKAARDAAWAKFTGWFSGLVKKVDMTK